MARVTVEESLLKEENHFALVGLVCRRARQLERGAHLLLSEEMKIKAQKNKSVVKALREVEVGAIRYNIDESVKSRQEQLEEFFFT